MPHLSLALALALAAGLAGGVLIDTPLTVAASIALAAGWLLAALAYARAWPRVVLAAVVLAMLGAGWLFGAHAVDRALHPPLRSLLEQRVGGFAIEAAPGSRAEEPFVIEGRLLADAQPTETGAVLRLRVERIWIGPCPEPAAGGVSVGVSGALHAAHLAEWTAGRTVRAPALLRRPAVYLNDGLPDQERALARRGIALVGTIKSAALVEIVARGRWWEEAAAAVRARTRDAIARHVRVYGARSGAIATAILIGDRAGLDVETERRLQEAGTYHVIAISGGNIAILAGLVLLLLKWVGVRGRAAAVATIAALAAFAVIAAGGASVARATLMASVYLAVRLIDQRTAAVNAIGLTGGALLLANPLSIVDVGFWLTFGATAALVAGASLTRVLSPGTGTPHPAPAPGTGTSSSPARRVAALAAAVVVATMCVELALAPVGAMVFQRVTFAGLLLNLAALPAMTLVQIGAMVVAALDVLGAASAAAAAGWVVHAATVALTDSARLLDYAPWLAWRVPSPASVVTAAYYAALVVVVWQWRVSHGSRVTARAAAAVAAVLFLWIVIAPPARVRAAGDGRLHLTLIDVGQGDALLVTFPNGRALAVDTGGVNPRGEFDVGDRVIGPALRARGLLRLDYLAVTHGDPDHAGGARALVRDFTPGEVWWGTPVANHQPESALRAEAARVRAAWRTLQRGDRLEIGGVELRVHHPPPPDWERQKVRNDDSLVFEVRFGEVSMLLTGDIGREVEQELLPSLDLLPTVILKVPHHGSGTSSSTDFLDRVRPQVALIGVGRANPYGHPVPYVLERYHARGTRIFRTDLDGQISVSTDGREIQVSTYTARRAR
jgi:competence protein ComEC